MDYIGRLLAFGGRLLLVMAFLVGSGARAQPEPWLNSAPWLDSEPRAFESKPSFVPMMAQQASNWCWAAAVQNLLAQVGIMHSQAEIVSYAIGGYPADITATAAQVTRLLHSYGIAAKHLRRGLKQRELSHYLRQNQRVLAVTHPYMIQHALVVQGEGRRGAFLISDTMTGVTDYYSYWNLVAQWWQESIIVFPPSGEVTIEPRRPSFGQNSRNRLRLVRSTESHR